MISEKKFIIHIFVYSLIFITCAASAPFIGATKLSFADILNDSSSIDFSIFFNQRLPRVLTGILCGAGLSAAGACLQVILKNPLAEPYILGISGFSALFLCISIVVLNSVVPSGIASFAGALTAVFIIDYTFNAFKGDSGSTILAGVSLNILSGSMILFLKYFASPDKLVLVERWFMGSLDILGYDNLFILFLLVFGGIIFVYIFASELNILGFDSNIAGTRGFDPDKVRRKVFLASGMIASAVVWIAGPIGFVGLIIPHIVRQISGNDMKIVLPGSALLGGGFLVLCDIFSRILIAPAELPVGIITSVTGSPVFLFILFKMRKKN
jgi:iron complex transport system permease protein